MNSTSSKRSPRPASGRKSQAEVLEQWEGDPSFMQSLARGLLVLNAVAKAPGGSVTVAELVNLTGLPRATVRRCIYTLEAVGYLRLAQDGAGPGPELVTMTTSYYSSSPLLTAHKPIIEKLRDDTGQSVAFGVYDGWKPVVVSNAPSRSALKITIAPTDEYPLYMTSIGRVLLASKPDVEVLDYLRRVEKVSRTPRSISGIPELREAIRKVKAAGYSVVEEEAEPGLRSITVPVQDGQGALAAWINIGTHVAITGAREVNSKIVPRMLRAAEELSSLTP